MPSVKVSIRNQIVIPSNARARLGIGAGDRLDVSITDDAIVLSKRRTHPSDRLRGLAAGRGWYDPDPVSYVRALRDGWDDRQG